MTFRNRVEGKTGKETLTMIRDLKVEKQLSYQLIAEELNLSPDFVFNAIILLMRKKQLAWKPTFVEITTKIPDPKDPTIMTDVVEKRFKPEYYIPAQKMPKEKKPILSFKKNKLEKSDSKTQPKPKRTFRLFKRHEKNDS